MMTIKQILARTPASIKVNAADVIIKEAKVKRPKNGNPVFTCIAYSKYTAAGKYKGGRYETHKVKVTGLMGAGSAISQKYVKVECDCGYFWSHCEVALHKQGAADIIHSNGAKPVVTNPRMIPHVCKHLHAVLEKILLKQV